MSVTSQQANPGVQRVTVGASARSALPRSSYGDAFTVRARASHTAEQWARQAFESGPRAQRRLFSLVVWQGLLGLRLSPEGVPGTVAGWDIAVNESGTLVLRADSWMLAASLIVETTPEQATLTTLLRYDRPPARAVWTALSIAHRAVAPGVLAGAAQSLARK